MLSLGPLGFASPWLLAALVALPALWIILRAMPPAPRIQRFPGTALLVGLADRAAIARRTPWWLLVMRSLAVAALIAGFAGPVWRPAQDDAGRGPLLVIVDAGWAAAPVWQDRVARARDAIAGAGDAPVAVLIADGTRAGPLPFRDAARADAALRAAQPAAWDSRYPPDPDAALALAPPRLRTLWVTDGLDHPGRAAWLTAVAARGAVQVRPPPLAPASLTLDRTEPPTLALRLVGPPPTAPPAILASGPDPQGIPRVLARLTPGTPTSRDGIASLPVPLDLPPELRNRVTRFEVEGIASAGTVWLADERTQRRKVALVAPIGASEGQTLLAPLHYLRQALSPRSDVIEGGLADVLAAAPDVVVLSDAVVAADDTLLRSWVEDGGTLIRFAGPRMAASGALLEDPLLPLRLRPGGRDMGGALSWGDPRGLAALPADGPFAGLPVPGDIRVRAQLMAEPGPEVAPHVLASLSDDTPLVSRTVLGAGQVVLFHVTANAEWSDLPLSGLFVQMLDRLVQSARPAGGGGDAANLSGDQQVVATEGLWTAQTVLDGFGRVAADDAGATPVPQARLAAGPAPGLPAGLYAAGPRRYALNAGGPLAAAQWPGAAIVQGATRPGLPLQGWLVALALVVLSADAVFSAALAQGWRRRGQAPGGVA